MRHANFGRKLNRSSSHRKALRKNLITSLFTHGRIVTTMPKAKAAKPDAERLITLSKVDSICNMRRAFAYLQDDSLVKKLFKEIGVKYRDTDGGYTSIHRLSKNRIGDNGSQVVWELVTWEPGTKPKPRHKRKAAGRKQEKPEAVEGAETAPTESGAAPKSAAKAEPPDSKREKKE